MSETRQGHHHHRPFVPLLLIAGGFLFWTLFQTVQLVREGGQLDTANAGLEPLMTNSRRLRESLDELASETQRLADAGNANAQLLVDELRKRGVTINVPGGQ